MTTERRPVTTITVRIAGEARELPVLPHKRATAWAQLVGEQFTTDVSELIGDADAKAVNGLLSRFSDGLVELVTAYDAGSRLGGREYLEDHATTGELYAVFRACLAETFPFVKDLQTALVAFRDLQAAGAKARAAAAKDQGALPSPNGVPAEAARP